MKYPLVIPGDTSVDGCYFLLSMKSSKRVRDMSGIYLTVFCRGLDL